MRIMLAVLAASAVTHCQARSVGPGSLRRGGMAGAACLMSAFQNGCRPADYPLSSFGVDTAHTRRFVVERRNGACAVLVVDSNRVIPRPPLVISRRTCSRVHRLNGAIVADRCTTHETVSLTKIS
jgi:hypothetical protein